MAFARGWPFSWTYDAAPGPWSCRTRCKVNAQRGRPWAVSGAEHPGARVQPRLVAGGNSTAALRLKPSHLRMSGAYVGPHVGRRSGGKLAAHVPNDATGHGADAPRRDAHRRFSRRPRAVRAASAHVTRRRPDRGLVEPVLQRPKSGPAGNRSGEIHVLPLLVIARLLLQTLKAVK
jgi:hypothetical protein